MAFATVNKSGLECLFNKKPIRKKGFWDPSVIGQTSTLNVWGDKHYCPDCCKFNDILSQYV